MAATPGAQGSGGQAATRAITQVTITADAACEVLPFTRTRRRIREDGDHVLVGVGPGNGYVSSERGGPAAPSAAGRAARRAATHPGRRGGIRPARAEIRVRALSEFQSNPVHQLLHRRVMHFLETGMHSVRAARRWPCTSAGRRYRKGNPSRTRRCGSVSITRPPRAARPPCGPGTPTPAPRPCGTSARRRPWAGRPRRSRGRCWWNGCRGCGSRCRRRTWCGARASSSGCPSPGGGDARRRTPPSRCPGGCTSSRGTAVRAVRGRPRTAGYRKMPVCPSE